MQEQIPKIERSVAYTFDAYSGGLKIEGSGRLFRVYVYAGIHDSIFDLFFCPILRQRPETTEKLKCNSALHLRL